MEDSTALESCGLAKEKPELKEIHNGLNGYSNGIVGPIYNPEPTNVPRLIVDVEHAMEVDDEEHGISDEVPELQYFRSHGDRQIRPSSVSIKSSTMAFDAVTLSSTRSLFDTDLEYYVENNRRYVPNYFMPNDEDEQLRLQIVHQLYLSMLNSKLTTVPLTNPAKILDIGTGTGEWAIGMAETYPKADVTGVDLSAIQPTAVPPNVFFEIFDAEDDDDWTYPENYFDLINFRNMTGSFRSWDLMYERAYRHLKPGGWIEIADFDDQESGFLSYLGKDSEVRSWCLALSDALGRSGKEINSIHLDPVRIAKTGFENVEITRKHVPIGAWPTDPNVRGMAKLWLVACLAGFEAYSLRPLTQDMGWSAEEVHRICKKMQSELKSCALDTEKAEGMSVAITIMVGRKPISPLDEDAAMFGNRDSLEVDDAQPDCKRVKTRASSQENMETPQQEDDSDFVIEPEMMQEFRKRFRRAGDIAQDVTISNGVNLAYRGSGRDAEMKL